jgi:hypothetical protein
MEVYELRFDKVLKNGHTMFLQDVVYDLNRKAFLESERTKALSTDIETENKLLFIAIEERLLFLKESEIIEAKNGYPKDAEKYQYAHSTLSEFYEKFKTLLLIKSK